MLPRPDGQNVHAADWRAGRRLVAAGLRRAAAGPFLRQSERF